MSVNKQMPASGNAGRARWLGIGKVFYFLLGFAALISLGIGSLPSVAPTAAAGCQPTNAARTNEIGLASYYGAQYQGKPTASGEIFDMEKMTAAHRRLAFGTKLKVTLRDTGQTVVVCVNDRGPFIAGRVVDLSLAAARELHLLERGLAEVELEVIK